MTYEKFFADIKRAYSKADKRKLGDDFAFQFNITGEGEGIFYVAYRGGILEIAPYDYVDKNATLYATGENFVKLANGRISIEEAISTEAIRIVGDSELALELNKIALYTPDKKDPPKKPKKETPAAKPADVKKTGTVKSAPPPSSIATATASTTAQNIINAVKDIPGEEELV